MEDDIGLAAIHGARVLLNLLILHSRLVVAEEATLRIFDQGSEDLNSGIKFGSFPNSMGFQHMCAFSPR